jgi:DNA modification methylase
MSAPTIHHGDCLDVLATLPDASVDAVVTDPPYGLEFMGKEWDSFKTYAGGNPNMKPQGASIEATAEGDWQPGRAYGSRQKNPRCRRCGKLSRGNGCCKCPEPQWDTRTAEGANQYQFWCQEWAEEVWRVLKPGGHMLAFGGTRTFHRLACAVEDAGFEIRDSIAWLYGSGFPKSLDVSKAIDKAAGAEREVVGPNRYASPGRRVGVSSVLSNNGPALMGNKGPETAPATPEAEQWQGWGTALKPAFEPIVVARKPLAGTVAANVLAHGTGALNVDATRIGAREWEDDESLCASCAAPADNSARPTAPASGASTATRPAEPTTNARAAVTPAATSRAVTGCSDGTKAASTSTSSSTEPSGSSTTDPSPLATSGSSTTSTATSSTTASRTCNSCGAPSTTATTTSASPNGRWPSNVVLDESQAEALDAQSGELASGLMRAGTRPKGERETYGQDAAGGYETQRDTPGDSGGASRFFYVAKADAGERVRVNGTAHPTVKPLALMRWLVRLVTPPGGVVLDPFAGSGTTVEAAILEGFEVIAIEREADYLPLIHQRINRRRDPVAAVRATLEDAGLFDLIAPEEPA